MRKIRLETYRDIFKQFSIMDLEKTERVLSALQEYIKLRHAEGFLGIPIKELKCTEGDVKVALPILGGIRNILFPPSKNVADDDKTIMPIYMPTQEVTLTKDNKLTGLYLNDIVEKSLEEIGLYLSKNKIANKRKISLTLSNIGLKNELNEEVYAITGKRAEYLEILKNKSPLTARQISKITEQDEKTIWNAIQKINATTRSKLGLMEDLIVPVANGYSLNTSYKIKILKK